MGNGGDTGSVETQWHRGEDERHRLRQVPEQDNPASYFLSAAHQLTQSTLLALGTIDSEGRPWTSLWGGERGFEMAISQESIGISVSNSVPYFFTTTVIQYNTV